MRDMTPRLVEPTPPRSEPTAIIVHPAYVRPLWVQRRPFVFACLLAVAAVCSTVAVSVVG